MFSALSLLRGILLYCGLVAASTAHAACPMALAVYGERGELAGIDFRPNGDAAAVTNTFKMWVGDGVLLDGIVMWTDEPARSVGMLMHKCPEGDVTGEELAACTLWQGVVYTADGQGNVGLVPKHDEAAPERLIFPGLGPALRQSPIFGANGFTKEPWDVLHLKGCQE
jgi:hypothetical protein